jgi:succinate dehydrogenase/fumarate reductase flavoprotein subunit
VNPTSTGDGIRMALECGGVVLNGDHMRGPGMRFAAPPRAGWLQRLPPIKPVTRTMRWAFEHLPQRLLRPVLMRFLTTSLAPAHDLFREGAILVDKDGVRFTDETQARDPLSAVVAQRRDASAFLVFDESLARRLNEWPHFISSAPSIGYAYLDDYRRTRADIFHSAPTVHALAARIGVPPEVMERTIAQYNSGSPSAPATHRGGRPALATPPYYALGPAIANIIYTDGGVKVNEHAQVLSVAGDVIAGLYAVGSNGQGGLLLKGHGHHLGWAFVSGRLAGRHAALAATEHMTRGGEQ